MRFKLLTPVAGIAAALGMLCVALVPTASYAMGCTTVPGVRGPDTCLPQLPQTTTPQINPYPTTPSANQSSGACASDGVHVVDCGGGLLIPPGQCVTIDSRVPGTSIGGVSQAGSGCASGSQGGSTQPTPAAPAPPAPVMPAPQVSVNDSYSTANGVRSVEQIQTELVKAGYPGPFDTASVLAAYQRTTNSPVRAL